MVVKVMVAGVNVLLVYCCKAWCRSCVGIFSWVSSERFLIFVNLLVNESLHMYSL